MKIEIETGLPLRTTALTDNWDSLKSRNRFKCPHCASLVYSRKSRFCGVCGTNLPASFLFTHAEQNSLKTVLDAERARHRQWLARRNEPSRPAPIFA